MNILLHPAGAALLAAAGRPEVQAGLGHLQTSRWVELALALVLVGLLVLVKRMAWPPTGLPSLKPGPVGLSAAGQAEKLAEAQAFSTFLSDFRTGPDAALAVAPARTGAPRPAPPATPHEGEPQETAAPSAGGRRQLEEFHAWAPKQADALRSFAQKCARLDGQEAQREILIQVCAGIAALKQRAEAPDLKPVWQLAAVIEGLLRQLTGRVSTITHSTQCTLADSLELLAQLCARGSRPDLVANPAIRILVVDDDQISRFALCVAINKAFDAPDVAENGEAALAMAGNHRYDLIILDVMMPTMDGFEVCSRLRQTGPNASTPVLFVTSLKDFDTRAKSLATAGNGLLGKPFLTFEITLKALTLILRARLGECSRLLEPSAGQTPVSTPAVHWPELGTQTEPAPDAPPPDGHLATLELAVNPAAPSRIALAPPVFADAVGRGVPGAPRQFSPEFLAYMTSFVREIKGQLKVIGGATQEATRKELLVRLHLRLESLSRRLDLPELQPAFELCCALEGLAKKLRDDPKKTGPTTLRTADVGLDLLKDLCVPGIRTDLSSHPPIRILVVDDEPVARRALTGALQMSFPRPVGADSGETALGLAAEKEFDLVFLDVFMPVTDGFTVCARIHETALNRSTPVVFVTSHSDDEFRAQAARCGGTDYVVKPFVFMEIPVKALTYVLRGRLQRAAEARPQPTEVTPALAPPNDTAPAA